MTVERHEKINVNYQLKWLPTYAPYMSQKFFRVTAPPVGRKG